jgi:hypothetical protein
MLNTVGMGSVLPFRLVSTAMLLVGALALFAWVRRRLGGWPALVATIPVLFLGAAFDDFLWFSSITFLGSMAGGMGALVALDRRDRLGDWLTCFGLVVSMLFSSLWLAFAAGVALDVALRRGERDWGRRAFVVGVPVVLYAIWWLTWGHKEESAVTWHNVILTPYFVLDSITAALGAIFGLAAPVEHLVKPSGPDLGQLIAIGLIGLVAWRLRRMERVPRSFWVVLATGLTFWILGGIAVTPGRVPWASRYYYPGAVFLLLIGAELLRGIPLKRRWTVAAAGIALAVSLAGNAHTLDGAYREHHVISEVVRADLAALEIARDTIEPNFFIDEEHGLTGFAHIDAGSYLSARDAYGSPADSESELLAAAETPRFAADTVLVGALRFGLDPVAASSLPTAGARETSPGATAMVSIPAGRCVSVRGGAAAPLLDLPPYGVAIRAGAEPVADIRMRRFASKDFSVDFGEGVEPNAAVAIAIPTDASPQPWKMQLEGGDATVCGLRAGG